MAIDLAIPWFSMTKIATVSTAIRLVGRGALELNEAVFRHVPAMEALRPREWAERITVRHLLACRRPREPDTGEVDPPG